MKRLIQRFRSFVRERFYLWLHDRPVSKEAYEHYPIEELNRTLTISIENHSDKEQSVTMFGANENIAIPRFGIPEDIEIKVAESSYGEMIMHSFTEGIQVEFMRIWGEKEQILNPITFQMKDCFGRVLRYILQPSNYYSDKQRVKDVVDITKLKTHINGRNTMTWDMLPKAKITMSLFIAKSETPKDALKSSEANNPMSNIPSQEGYQM